MEECELLRQDMLQNSLTIEGEFVSESYMRDTLKFSELLALG